MSCIISVNICPYFLEKITDKLCLPIPSPFSVQNENDPQDLAGFLTIKSTSESVDVPNFCPNLSVNSYASSPLKRQAVSKAPQPRKKPALISNMAAPKVVNPVSTVQVGTPAQLFSDCIMDGQKMFICALCPYRTNRMSNIKRHVDSNQPEPVIFQMLHLWQDFH